MLLIQFRWAAVALSADISEMFRQVRLREKDDVLCTASCGGVLRLPENQKSMSFNAFHSVTSHRPFRLDRYYSRTSKPLPRSIQMLPRQWSENTQEAHVLQSELSNALRKGEFEKMVV